MSSISPLSELMLLLDAANASRRAVRGIGEVGAARSPLLRDLEDRFRVHHRLAIYGTLAPGKPNHHIVQPLGGKWRDGFVEGDLLAFGWGAAMGYPALLPRLGGESVPVNLLTTPHLETAWEQLDRFEGPDYERLLVPVFGGRRSLQANGMPIAVAHLYATRRDR
jgi:gamma-glutamylcyclotransferase (GGCT)/AIG2-like uncharacterized protein YtfP